MMLAAVILAAGESRRMGRPKALLPYPTQMETPGKLTFLEHLLAIAKHPKIAPVRVVLGARAETIQLKLKLPAGQILLNPDWPKGQLSSIHTAIRHLQSTQPSGLMIFLIDHPLISSALVEELVTAFERNGQSIIVPTFQGKRGHPVIFPGSLFDELLAAPLETGARAVVWAHADKVVEVPTVEEGVVLNLNDPKAYRQARSLN